MKKADFFVSALLRRLPPRVAEKIFYKFFCGKSQVPVETKTNVGSAFARRHTVLSIIRGDVIGHSLFYTGAYEPHTTRKLLEIASREGGLFVDVGANLGYYSVLWCQARAGNHCIAIEASPRNVKLLTENILQNNLTDACTILPVAASNCSGTVSFDQGPITQTGWGGISPGVDSGARLIRVEARSLDEMLSTMPTARLMKIDVEGAEALVIEGAAALLRAKKIGEVWFEDNKDRRKMLGIDLNRILSVFDTNGYCVDKCTYQNKLAMDYIATKTPFHATSNRNLHDQRNAVKNS
jgi:FkbM family methyltransferase